MRDVEPLEALGRIIYCLDRAHEPAHRVKAFVKAAEVVHQVGPDRLAELHAAGRLTELEGVGPKIESVLAETLDGRTPSYLAEVENRTALSPSEDAAGLLELLRGDAHMHSTWSDGGAPIETMARTAAALGRDWIVITDHSPRLSVARGLTAERLRSQLEEVARLNDELSPFRILTGIEVDINPDGSLDQDPDLLEELDVVVASVHSELRMPQSEMTRRLVLAMANPRTDIIGHITNRMRPREGSRRRGRGESSFDPEVVFAAAARFDKAIEVNCRPERLDPPMRLLELALDWDCKLAIDTDAHAPGQLEWTVHGVERAVEVGVEPDRIVTTWSADELVEWAAGHRLAAAP